MWKIRSKLYWSKFARPSKQFLPQLVIWTLTVISPRLILLKWLRHRQKHPVLRFLVLVKLYGVKRANTGAFAGTTSLPAVVVPGTNPAFAGQVFIPNGFAGGNCMEREYRNLSGQLANPAMSTSAASGGAVTNLQVQFQVPQLLVPYQAGAF